MNGRNGPRREEHRLIKHTSDNRGTGDSGTKEDRRNTTGRQEVTIKYPVVQKTITKFYLLSSVGTMKSLVSVTDSVVR